MDTEADIFLLVDNPNALPLDGAHLWDEASVQRALDMRGNSALVHFAICEAVMPANDAKALAALLCKHDQKTLLFVAKTIVAAHKLLTNVGNADVEGIARYKMIDLRTALDKSIVDAKVKHVPVHGTLKDMVASGVIDLVVYSHDGDESNVHMTLGDKTVFMENGMTVREDATLNPWDAEVFAHLERKTAGDGVGSVQELPPIKFMVAGGAEVVNGSLSNARASLVVDVISKTMIGFSFDLAKGRDAVAKAIYDRLLKVDSRLDKIKKSVFRVLEAHLPQDKFLRPSSVNSRMITLRDIVKRDGTKDLFAEFITMRLNSQRARSGYEDVGKNAVSWGLGCVHPSLGVFEKQYVALSASQISPDLRVLMVGVGKKFHAYDAIKAYGLTSWKAIDIVEFDHREKQNIICGDFFKQGLENFDYVFSDGYVPVAPGKGKGTKHDPHEYMMSTWSFVKHCFSKKINIFTCKVVVPSSMFLSSLPDFMPALFGSYEIINISPGASIHSGEHYVTFKKSTNPLNANSSYNSYIAMLLPVIEWATYANWARNTCLAYGIGLEPSLFVEARMACFGRLLFDVETYVYREISTVAHHSSTVADQFVFEDLEDDEELTPGGVIIKPVTSLRNVAEGSVAATIRAGTLYQPVMGSFVADCFNSEGMGVLPFVGDTKYYTNIDKDNLISSSSSVGDDYDVDHSNKHVSGSDKNNDSSDF